MGMEISMWTGQHAGSRLAQSTIPKARLITWERRVWRWKAKMGVEFAESINMEALKKNVMRSIANTNRGKATTYSQRKQILRLIEDLESQNPISNPVESPLLSGYWSLLYTAPVDEKTSDKYAGAEEGPFLSRVSPLALGTVRQTRSSQIIDTEKGVAENIAEFKFFGADGTLTIKGKAARSSLVRLDVTFEEFVFRVGGWESPAISLRWINPRGWVDTTFLDEDLRIGRGDKGSIFVSARVKR